MLDKVVSSISIDTIFDSRDLACSLSTPHRNVKPRSLGNLLRERDDVVLYSKDCKWKKISPSSGDTNNV